MKGTKLFWLYAILIFTASAAALHARAIQEDYRKADEKARVSYAFGMMLGSELKGTELEFNYEAFAQGLKAVIEDGGGLFSEQEAFEIVNTAMQNAMERRTEENRIKEEFFLAENMGRPGIIITESGLQYEVLEEGEGEKPQPDSVVRVHYEGSLTDGVIFDSSYNDGESAVIPLERVIPGWTEGLLLMNVGSKYRLYIPSSLAYGSSGASQIIPPYSTLIFTVELLEIIDSE
ncbi:MAG: FKBP-type peptidyl-prolyl cis-trans isomerase [Treponema sp.]|nr:FKBP-type peptidyl-prolyl cis-trans isomerase [Treponema sp.]